MSTEDKDKQKLHQNLIKKRHRKRAKKDFQQWKTTFIEEKI